jgi:hypothetical protein
MELMKIDVPRAVICMKKKYVVMITNFKHTVPVPGKGRAIVEIES